MQTIYILYTGFDNRPVDHKAFRDKQLLINHYNIEYHSMPAYSVPGLDYDIGGWGKKGCSDDFTLYIEEFNLE